MHFRITTPGRVFEQTFQNKYAETPDVISDDAQLDTFDELDNVYDDLYDDNVMTETEFHEPFGDSDDEEWTYLTPDGRPC